MGLLVSHLDDESMHALTLATHIQLSEKENMGCRLGWKFLCSCLILLSRNAYSTVFRKGSPRLPHHTFMAPMCGVRKTSSPFCRWLIARVIILLCNVGLNFPYRNKLLDVLVGDSLQSVWPRIQSYGEVKERELASALKKNKTRTHTEETQAIMMG